MTGIPHGTLLSIGIKTPDVLIKNNRLAGAINYAKIALTADTENTQIFNNFFRGNSNTHDIINTASSKNVLISGNTIFKAARISPWGGAEATISVIANSTICHTASL
jgi:hypothetical protein